ncbi:transmembrane protein 54 isoform X1 [Haliaeetus albicilla]|uniref:transmembrane protein 54 isoform X1 n=1 Tax=Haliaeetus albicilla TaxID=8969 RepID=UPI0037E8BB01
MCQVGHLDPGSHQRVLMKTGLILLIIGHLNFITGALVHGTVLRFVVNPRDAISLQYAVANAASVISALLTISCGIAALVLSRCLAPATLVSTLPSTQQDAAIPWSVHRLTTLSFLSPPAEMGGFCPECQQQPGLPVLPAGAGRLHRADAGQPGPGTAGPLHHRRRRPRPGLTPVPLRSHPCLQLHAVSLGYLPPARLDGDHLWHPLPSAHPRPPSPRPLLLQGAPEKGLLAGRPCGEPRPRAVPGLAEVGQRGNCPALSRAQGLMPWTCPGQPCPIPAPAQPHIGNWLLPSPAMGQTHPLDTTSQDT